MKAIPVNFKCTTIFRIWIIDYSFPTSHKKYQTRFLLKSIAPIKLFPEQIFILYVTAIHVFVGTFIVFTKQRFRVAVALN